MDLDSYNAIMHEKCIGAVNYSLLLTKDQVQIAVEHDDILPVPDSKHDEINYYVGDSAAIYHSFIHLTINIENKNKSSTFTVVICPFEILNSEEYRYAIENLVQLTYDPDTRSFGQNAAEIGLVDGIAADILVDQNLDDNKRNEKLLASKSAYYTIKYSFPSVAKTFQLVKQTPPNQIVPFRSQYCQSCRQIG